MSEKVIEESEDVSNQISRYVNEYYRKQLNEKEIVDVLSPSLGLQEDLLKKSSIDDTLQVIRPTLEKAGLIDDSTDEIKSLSPNDQDLLRKVKEISNYINNYMHKVAKQELDSISDQINHAADSVKSKYHNNYGVFFFQNGDLENAFSEFSKAVQLYPDNFKAVANVVQVEYELYRKGWWWLGFFGQPKPVYK